MKGSWKDYDLRKIAEQVTRINQSRADASNQVRDVIHGLGRAFREYSLAHNVARDLHESKALGGPQATELREWYEHLQSCRDLMAEAAFLLASVYPDQTMIVITLDEMRTAAIEGMQAKRLAGWEADALREVAVKVLAGEPANAGKKPV